jgi:acyl-CoA dehydrogenase
MTVLDRIAASSGLSEDEQMIFEAVSSLCRDQISTRAAAYDASGDFPWENIEAINDLALNGMFIPEEYGGTPMSFRCYLACVKQISAACASTGIIWATNYHAMKPLIDFGSHEQKSRLLPRIANGGLASLAITEPDAGSDATRMKTQFREDGDSIIVDGNKCFITNGDVADLYLVFGKWSAIEDPKGAISVAVIEKTASGIRVIRNEDKMGTRASSTTSLAFDGVRIPRENLLGNPGDGLRILFASLNKSRPSVAAHALGIARAAFDDAVEYINGRKQSGKRILEFQGIQFLIADLAAEYALCDSFLWTIGKMVDEGGKDFSIEASILKMRASDLAMRVTTEAVQLHGGYGYCRDYRVERLMRDAKITQIWEGTNQVHRQLIGRSFLNKHPKA